MASILVIDDEPAVRQIVRRILERSGHRTSDASGGRVGLAMMREQKFDLVITDMLMPDMEGIETIREIRAHHSSMPILAMSGGGVTTGNVMLLNAAAKLGAGAILEKPFRAAQLLQSVERLLAESVGVAINPDASAHNGGESR